MSAVITSSLASAKPGDRLRIETFLYAALEDYCEDVGLLRGDVVKCVASTAAMLVLQTSQDRKVLLQTDLARFIKAQPL